MSYNAQYRKRTIEYYEEGHTFALTCKTFKISTSTLDRWIKQYRENGSFDTKPSSGRPSKLNRSALEQYIKQNPDSYQSEIGKKFGCGQSAVSQALKKMGYTRKKR